MNKPLQEQRLSTIQRNLNIIYVSPVVSWRNKCL